MKDRVHICVADIRNKIFEAGLLKPDERIVLVAGSCVLLEHFTGKKYSYRMVDLCTMNPRHLFTKKKVLTEHGYEKAMEAMLAQASPEGKSNGLRDRSVRVRELLTHIFCHILPEHGMVLRENQLSLAHSMLDAMEEKKVALCEAEVGIGKTYAYLLTAVLYRLFYGQSQSVVISTSTIALQKALEEDYIPQISDILMEHRIIDKPITFAVRKGKKHYACDTRVKTYMSSIKHNNRLEDQKLVETLLAIYTGGCPLDLDSLPITNYVRERICVEQCHRTCKFAGLCRYRTFLRKTEQRDLDFIIVNHNLVLADVLSQKGGRNRLFPEYCVLIFDESHKLLETARQMYGLRFERAELERLAVNIYRAVCSHPNKRKLILLCEEMLRQNLILFEALGNNAVIPHNTLSPGILGTLNELTMILKSLSLTLDMANFRLAGRIGQELEKLQVLKDYAQSIYWMEYTEMGVSSLCSLPKQLDCMLYEDIWKNRIPYILTSATMSVGGDFAYFMNHIGIDLLERHRVLAVSKVSPFDYQNHGLLYLPGDLPFPSPRNRLYMDSVLNRMEELVNQTHGHTLMLFTSYRMMETVHQELVRRIQDYPVFCMGKGHLETIEDFRNSGNGILLASDSAGEGIDLAGDILSSLVVVKLPFPAPDPVREYERSLHENFHSYLTESVVPDMLVKLRQWIGRGIRRETDTCVFSILDSRAGRRYRNEILAALPDMPVTERMEDVGRFIRENKPEGYFGDE